MIDADRAFQIFSVQHSPFYLFSKFSQRKRSQSVLYKFIVLFIKHLNKITSRKVVRLSHLRPKFSSTKLTKHQVAGSALSLLRPSGGLDSMGGSPRVAGAQHGPRCLEVWNLEALRSKTWNNMKQQQEQHETTTTRTTRTRTTRTPAATTKIFSILQLSKLSACADMHNCTDYRAGW